MNDEPETTTVNVQQATWTPTGEPHFRPPVNTRTGAEGRLFSLIFNGLTHALAADEWMVLSRRFAVADLITDELLHNGLQPQFTDGLALLRAVGSESAT